MLAFALILALAAHSTLAKPTGLCLYPCDTGASSGYTHAGYAQPSSNQASSGFGQMGSSFGQMGSSFGQMGSGFGQNSFRNMFSGMQGMGGGMQGMGGGMQGMGGGMTHGNLEDFSTVNVQQPSRPMMAQMPQYMPSVVGHSQRVESQVPVQPQIEGMFTHSSGKASFESNNGFMKIHQPGFSQTVISEPIIRQKLVQPASNPCQNYYDPCL